MKKISTARLDDVDYSIDRSETPADVTVRIRYGGTDYELDLTYEHAEDLDGTLKPWLDAAAVVSGARKARRPAAPRSVPWHESRDQGAALREFAREHGIRCEKSKISGRYYYSSELRRAFAKAQQDAR